MLGRRPVGIEKESMALLRRLSALSPSDEARCVLGWAPKTPAMADFEVAAGASTTSSFGPDCQGEGISLLRPGWEGGGSTPRVIPRSLPGKGGELLLCAMTGDVAAAAADVVDDSDVWLLWIGLAGFGSTPSAITSNKPPPGRLSRAAAFSAAGVLGDVNRVATELIAGWMMD